MAAQNGVLMMKLADKMARMFTQKRPYCSFLFGDLRSAALLALVEALQRYDSSQGIDPLVFASPRAHGSMLDYLRREDTVDRYRRRAIREERDTSQEPVPRLVDLDAALGVPDPAPIADEGLVNLDQVKLLRELVQKLPPRLRKVVNWRMRGCTLRQIADELGVTEARACQLMGEAVRNLRQLAAVRKGGPGG